MSERTVRVFGPEGFRRRNTTPENAQYLVQVNVVYPLCSRKGEITSIHHYGIHKSPRPIEVRVKTGTRFTHREHVGDTSVIAHNSLPYSAVNAQLGGCSPWEEVEAEVRNLYCGVALSIARHARNYHVKGTN
jgi:hypothetical protein